MSDVSVDTLVVGELLDDQLHPTVPQLLSAANRVTTSPSCIALALPLSDGGLDATAEGLNVGRVIGMQHAAASEDAVDGVYALSVELVANLVATYQPRVVMFAKTDFGAIVSARIAARLNAALAADCIDLVTNPETSQIAVTRPVHGGSAIAVFEFAGDATNFITIRPGAFEPEDRTGAAPQVDIVDMSDVELGDATASLVETVTEAGEGIPLERAEVVVAGGRGLGGEQPFDQLRELCNLLGAALGASRAACDAGWIDHSHQIGLTGKSINPTTYVTVGISGASQHMAGCSSARNIVAIDKDAQANIFSHARFGVVGDWEKVLPAFIAAVGELE